MNINPTTPQPHASVIRIVLVDDHCLLRETMMHILNDQADIQVVGDASGNAEALAMIDREQPAVVVQDICVGQDNGLDMLRHLKSTAPHIKCLVLTAYTEDDFILEAIENHADGYLLKDCSMPILINAIRQVAAGHKCWGESVLKRLSDIHSHKRMSASEGKIEYLSPGEKEITRLVAEGLTNSEIGQKVHLAEKTIRNRVCMIMDKLHIPRRTKLAAMYADHFGRKKKLFQ